jgi:hypothetical protein
MCILLLLPLDWPGVFILGEEWEPSLGVWGSRSAMVLFSLPLTYFLARVWCALIPMRDPAANKSLHSTPR